MNQPNSFPAADDELSRQPIDDTLVPASIDDLGVVKNLLQEASDFKYSQGDDLWGTEPFTDEEVSKMIKTGNMFIFKVDDVPAATVILAKNDEQMWGDEQGSDGSAVYIHKLCVGNEFRGQGIGTKVIDRAVNFTLNSGLSTLRLDCPYDNRSLCGYYESLGFHESRRRDIPLSLGGRNTTKDIYGVALYERDLASASPPT